MMSAVAQLVECELDLESKGYQFATHWRHCVVPMSKVSKGAKRHNKSLYPLLSTGSQEDRKMSNHALGR